MTKMPGRGAISRNRNPYELPKHKGFWHWIDALCRDGKDHRLSHRLDLQVLWAMGVVFANVILYTPASLAEIVPNGLGTSVDFQDCSESCTITGGSTRDANLFHSFEAFSVPSNSIATFQHDGAIANIITRVTGDSTSRINGTIQTLLDGSTDDRGTADFFFLNPNGIVFGANAQLNIGGSFIGSTAASLQFEDGADFSVNEANPLLTISAPIGLQFGADPGNIRVVGAGNGLFLNPDATVNRSDRPTGLSVTSGNTLALAGNTVKLNGGNLTAEAGRIEVGAVGGNSTILLEATATGWALDYSNVEEFGNIQLLNAASADVTGDDAGILSLQGKNITLQDGSSLLANTLVNGGGEISIQATDDLQMSGLSASVPDEPFTPIPTSTYIEISPGAVGDGSSELLIQTSQLNLDGGAQIGLSMGGLGNSGVVNIQADHIQANSGAPTAFSGIFTAVLPVFPAPPDFTSPPPAAGLGGDLNIQTDTLEVINGAQMVASTFGIGNAGNFTIEAKDVRIIGFNPGGASTLQSASAIPPAGNGGQLTIDTERLVVSNGGQIATSTVSAQPAGDLIVRATDSILIEGTTVFGSSGLFANAISDRDPTDGTVTALGGEGGSILLETNTLQVREGGSVNVSNQPSNPEVPFAAPGTGAAGNLTITAHQIQLENQGLLTADTVDGDRANINLHSDLIILGDLSQITTNATGIATGGNLVIDTLTLTAFNNSDITANAVESQGGNIQIHAQSIFGIQPREVLTPFSDITASSRFGLDGTIVIEAPDVEPEQGLVDLSSEVIDVTQLIAQECRQDDQSAYSQFSVTGRGGVPSHPAGLLNRRAILASPSRPIDVSNATQPETATMASGTITGSTPIPPSTETIAPITEAMGWSVNSHGQVTLATEIQSPLVHAYVPRQSRTRCTDL